MTLSLDRIKRVPDNFPQEPKRQRLSGADARIQELLRNRITVKNCTDLLTAWYKLSEIPIPKSLKKTLSVKASQFPPTPGDNRLHLAIKIGDYSLVKSVLKEQEANASEQNSEGLDALQLAHLVGDKKIQHLFVKKNLRDANGNTLLHLMYGTPSSAPDFMQLQSAKPNLTLENAQEKTCYELAAANFHRKSFRQMMAYMEEQRQTIPEPKSLSARVSIYRHPELSFPFLPHILECLTFDPNTLTSIEQVNHHARKSVRPVYIQIIERYGYQVQSYLEAKKTFKALFNEISYLDATGCLNNVFINCRPKSSPHTGIKATLLREMHSLSRNQIVTFLSQYPHLYYRRESSLEKYGLRNDSSELLSIFKWKGTWDKAEKEDNPVDPEKGALAVHYATECRETEIVERLLEIKAPIANCRHEYDLSTCNNPLFDAIDYLPMTELLVKHKADVNAKDSHGDTVLVNAIKMRTVGVTEFLLKNKADPNLPVHGKTPLMVAQKHQQTEIANLLVMYGAYQVANQ